MLPLHVQSKFPHPIDINYINTTIFELENKILVSITVAVAKVGG